MPAPTDMTRNETIAISRRTAMFGLPLFVAGCVTQPQPAAVTPDGGIDPYYVSMYGPVPNEPFPVPALNIRRVDPRYFRQIVDYTGPHRPGTIVVDPNQKFLYLVLENGKAMRYGVGVGKQGLEWSGTAVIRRKAEWPRWIPTKEMIAREPERYGPWAKGMDGGLENPLGARALYLYQGNVDTYYRIHGTTEPYSIGTAVSSGCIRLMNQDIIDLYARVPEGTEVVVLG